MPINPPVPRDTAIRPALILGAGVNGAALARELLLSGVPVVIVEKFDVAYGATSKSSRLIHGGVRYLEYGDLKLVRESLEERTRLLQLAPHLVRPLRMAIPVRTRFRGFAAAAARFLGCGRRRGLRWLSRLTNSRGRGLWVVRFGLWLYDRLSRDAQFPGHAVRRVDRSDQPRVDADQYRWLCEYTDGQMLFPERFVIELLEDARRIAAERGLTFELHTYTDVVLSSTGTARIVNRPVEAGTDITGRDGAAASSARETDQKEFAPAAIVNATGAWGDFTLKQLGVEAPRLFGGTKGSHLITYHAGLRESIGDSGIYAEADDGRLVFVLPYREGVLVGTTDERFEQPPEQAVATAEEIDYLLELVNELVPSVGLTKNDVSSHYSGVRPLPFAPAGKTPAISRDHEVRSHPSAAVPTFTLIGGKLTTARAFGEQAAQSVLESLGLSVHENSRGRQLPGGVDFPASADDVQRRIDGIAAEFSLPVQSVHAMWELFGTRTAEVLQEAGDLEQSHRMRPDSHGMRPVGLGDMLSGTSYPVAVVRWVIAREWVQEPGDLVERRLMLADRPDLSRATLRHLAELLAEAGLLPSRDVPHAVDAVVQHLQTQYGKRV